MNPLEQILGGLTRQAGFDSAPKQSALLDMALQFVRNYPGGLAGLVAAFTGAGYEREANSWVGRGANLPISPEVLSQIFGGQLQSMGDRYGLDTREASDGLASVLPQLIDRATPEGRLGPQADGDELGALLDGFRSSLGR